MLGGGLGNAVLFSIGAALRAAGSRVLYFAGYKAVQDRYKVEEIERAADVIVWCCDEYPGFLPNPDRPQDRSVSGNIVQGMAAYGSGQLGAQAIRLSDVEHMIVIGSDRMMQAVGVARHGVLAPYLKHGAHGDRVDQLADAVHDEGGLRAVPAAAGRSVDAERRPWCSRASIRTRRWTGWISPRCTSGLGQNSTQEKLTAQWIDRALRRLAGAGGWRRSKSARPHDRRSATRRDQPALPAKQRFDAILDRDDIRHTGLPVSVEARFDIQLTPRDIGHLVLIGDPERAVAHIPPRR